MNYQKEEMLMPAVVINHRKSVYLTSDLCPDRTGGIFTISIRNHSAQSVFLYSLCSIFVIDSFLTSFFHLFMYFGLFCFSSFEKQK